MIINELKIKINQFLDSDEAIEQICFEPSNVELIVDKRTFCDIVFKRFLKWLEEDQK